MKQKIGANEIFSVRSNVSNMYLMQKLTRFNLDARESSIAQQINNF